MPDAGGTGERRLLRESLNASVRREYEYGTLTLSPSVENDALLDSDPHKRNQAVMFVR